jgi:hypothetical protein
MMAALSGIENEVYRVQQKVAATCFNIHVKEVNQIMMGADKSLAL